MHNGISIIGTMRTYSIELRARTYPAFSGTYNAYVACYGQLSGEYLGACDKPIAMDIREEEASDLLSQVEAFVYEYGGYPVIW